MERPVVLTDPTDDPRHLHRPVDGRADVLCAIDCAIDKDSYVSSMPVRFPVGSGIFLDVAARIPA